MQPPSLPNLPRGVVEGLPSGSFFAEELGSVRIYRRHHQGAIQKIVLCCSHDVSAISRHPRQVAPCRYRYSWAFCGSCWEQTGSFEQSLPLSNADLRKSLICRPASTSPTSVPSRHGCKLLSVPARARALPRRAPAVSRIVQGDLQLEDGTRPPFRRETGQPMREYIAEAVVFQGELPEHRGHGGGLKDVRFCKVLAHAEGCACRLRVLAGC